MGEPWWPEHDEILRRAYPHNATERLAGVIGRTARAVYQRAKQLGLRKTDAYLASPQACRLRAGDGRGAGTRFKPGQTPANKGLRRPGWARGRMQDTQFRKGDRLGAAQHNYRPIGSERISKDGYLERKVTDNPNLVPARRWTGVHRLVWEQAHGPVPPGHAVAFLPGRRTIDAALITVDALELVSRQELMRRNTLHRYPPEVVQLVQLRGALNRKINRRSKA